MITVKQAYHIARQNSMGIKLDLMAYDFGDCWAFDRSGTEKMIGFRPIVVQKETGKVIPFDFPADFGRMEKAHRVKV